MGSTLNKISEYCPQSIYNLASRKRKRDATDDYCISQKESYEPKRRKMVCTAKYIYKTLFLDGRDFDITVDIMGKEWKLHKIYLQQSPYFASMFSGSWQESNKNRISIKVADPNITLEGLTVVLGALYPNDEVVIDPAQVIGIVAAARLFQLDGLIEQCLDVMMETITPSTAVSYYNAATQYSIGSLKDVLIKWLLCNLMYYHGEHPSNLKDISPELMEILVKNKDLCVIQLEFSLYLLLTSWLMLRIRPRLADADIVALMNETRKYFKSRPRKDEYFLDTKEGSKYVKIFKGLKLQYLNLHHQDMQTVLEDRIIPRSWLDPCFMNLWLGQLKIDKGADTGPENLSESVFYKDCMRIGRVVDTNKELHSWKWNCYLMELDLIWTLTERAFFVKNNVSANHRRRFMCRVAIISKNSRNQVDVVADSGIQSVLMPNFQEFKLMDLPENISYPVLVSVNLLHTTPVVEEDNKNKASERLPEFCSSRI